MLFQPCFPRNHKLAVMSSLRLSSVLAEWCDIDSSDSCWRWGSIVTDWQTSESRELVSSLNSLCLIEGNPPVGHDKAWSLLKPWLQLQYEVYMYLRSGQSYLSERASLNTDLCITKACLSMASVVIHEDALFSWASSTYHWRLDGSWLCGILTSSFSLDCFPDFVVALSCWCSDWQSCRDWVWLMTLHVYQWPLISFDEECCSA